jgi:hypothetical protein
MRHHDRPRSHELIDVRFVGVVAHYFDVVAAPSILLDIERVTAVWVVEEWRDVFISRRNYGWPPVQFADLPDLVRQLGGMGVGGYRVMGSCGLDGFVLASGAEYRPRQQPVESAEQTAPAAGRPC